MTPSKFSSLTSLSTRLLLGLRAGQQDRAKVALRALAFLDRAPRLPRRVVALTQVLLEQGGGGQVAADDGVHVGQAQRVIGLDDGLRGGPGLEGAKHQLQQDAALADAED